jgi:hypothetical protein
MVYKWYDPRDIHLTWTWTQFECSCRCPDLGKPAFHKVSCRRARFSGIHSHLLQSWWQRNGTFAESLKRPESTLLFRAFIIVGQSELATIWFVGHVFTIMSPNLTPCPKSSRIFPLIRSSARMNSQMRMSWLVSLLEGTIMMQSPNVLNAKCVFSVFAITGPKSEHCSCLASWSHLMDESGWCERIGLMELYNLGI